MRKWLIGVVFALGFAGQVAGQGAAIEGVIGGQIEAFKADDFDTAFTFASPNIRGIFGTSENFGRMVTQGYPMVWRPAEVEFLSLREDRGLLAQRVKITDQAGMVHVLDYFMIETGDGWKINGVEFVRDPGVSA